MDGRTESTAAGVGRRVGHGSDGTSLAAGLSRCRGGGVVCPYCGAPGQARGGAAERCGVCRGRLDAASVEASRADMGPWAIASRPELAGASLGTMATLAGRGEIEPETIVRGPGTGWCWRYAADVPELARVFGFCHACRAAVEPEDAACGACGAQGVSGDMRVPVQVSTEPHREGRRRGGSGAIGVAAVGVAAGVLIGGIGVWGLGSLGLGLGARPLPVASDGTGQLDAPGSGVGVDDASAEAVGMSAEAFADVVVDGGGDVELDDAALEAVAARLIAGEPIAEGDVAARWRAAAAAISTVDRRASAFQGLP